MRSVPTETFGPVLARLIADRFADDPETGIAITAEKAGCDWTTIANIITQRRETCDFNTADELICALGQPQLWREEPLADIYETIDLSRTVCANPGCKVEFHDPHYAELAPAFCLYEGCKDEPKARGLCNKHYIQARSDGLLYTFPKFFAGRLTMYCSDACRQSAYQMREGITSSRKKNYFVNRDEKCRNGHARTTENTKRRKDGKLECLLCARETNRRSYHRRQKSKQSKATA